MTDKTWSERFDEEFEGKIYDDNGGHIHIENEIKSFIQSELSHRDQELLKELEGMKKTPEIKDVYGSLFCEKCGRLNYNDKQLSIHLAMKHKQRNKKWCLIYNHAIEDMQRKIEGEKV